MLANKGVCRNCPDRKEEEIPMVLLLFLALMFLLLLIDDHSRQMHLEQGLADYLKIEYRHTYPTSN